MNRNKIKGFTLIELLIVVAIVAIMATIAYPSYQEYVRKAKRAEATGSMLQATQFLERFYTENGNYETRRSDNSPIDETDLPLSNEIERNYDITFTPADNGQTFTLSAAPSATSPQQHDTKCGTLGIDETGTKTVSGTGTASDCW